MYNYIKGTRKLYIQMHLSQSQVLRHAYALLTLYTHKYTLPNLLMGFLLNSTLSKLCASGLKNCGIPNLALYERSIHN